MSWPQYLDISTLQPGSYYKFINPESSIILGVVLVENSEDSYIIKLLDSNDPRFKRNSTTYNRLNKNEWFPIERPFQLGAPSRGGKSRKNRGKKTKSRRKHKGSLY